MLLRTKSFFYAVSRANTETRKKREPNGESPSVISMHIIDLVRRDSLPLFNQKSFKMRTKNAKGNSKRVAKSVTIQLPIQSNPYGIPLIADYFAEIQRMYDVEKNIKNNLYAFILELGLFNELKEYSRIHDMSSEGGHKRAVASLERSVDLIKEKKIYDLINKN